MQGFNIRITCQAAEGPTRVTLDCEHQRFVQWSVSDRTTGGGMRCLVHDSVRTIKSIETATEIRNVTLAPGEQAAQFQPSQDYPFITKVEFEVVEGSPEVPCTFPGCNAFWSMDRVGDRDEHGGLGTGWAFVKVTDEAEELVTAHDHRTIHQHGNYMPGWNGQPAYQSISKMPDPDARVILQSNLISVEKVRALIEGRHAEDEDDALAMLEEWDDYASEAQEQYDTDNPPLPDLPLP